MLGGEIFRVNSRIGWLLCNVQVHVDCAGSGKMWAQLLRRDTRGVFSCQLELKIARDMFVCVSIAEARKKRPSRDIFPESV